MVDCARGSSLAGPTSIRLRVHLCDPGLSSHKPRGGSRPRHRRGSFDVNEQREGSETLRDTGAQSTGRTQRPCQQRLFRHLQHHSQATTVAFQGVDNPDYARLCDVAMVGPLLMMFLRRPSLNPKILECLSTEISQRARKIHQFCSLKLDPRVSLLCRRG